MRGFTLFIILFRRQILESYVPLVNEHPTNENKNGSHLVLAPPLRKCLPAGDIHLWKSALCDISDRRHRFMA